MLEFPCNFDILKNATGVIVHSSYSKKLFEDFYEESKRQIWTHIPLLREEVSKNIEIFKTKDDFIISSFGFLDNSKQNHILLIFCFYLLQHQRIVFELSLKTRMGFIL